MKEFAHLLTYGSSRILVVLLAIFLLCNLEVSAQAPVKNLDSLYLTLEDPDILDSLKVKNEIMIVMQLLELTLLDSAFQAAEQALEQAHHINYRSGIEQIPMIMGHILNLKGDQVGAIEVYTREINRHSKDSNEKILGYLILNRSSIYMDLEGYEQAISGLLEARELISSENDTMELSEKYTLSVLLNNLGRCNHQLKSYESALEYYQETEPLVENGLETTIGPSLYANIANAAVELNQYEMADEYFKRALRYTAPTDILTKSFIYTSLASYKEKTQSFEAADAFCDSVLAYEHIAELHGYLPTLYEIKYHIAKGKGRFEKALSFHEQYTIAKDSTSGVEKKLEFTRKEMSLQAEHEQQIAELNHESEIQIQEQENERKQLFYLLVFGGLALAGIIGWIVFSNRKKLQLEVLGRKSVDNELKALRAQMNPHFNSNAMSTVISKVRNGEPEDAIDYLTRFSRLMDGILKNSDLSVNSLDEEISLLKDYIELQKERFTNQFEFNIIVDEDLEEDELLIPSLILQPYVENSLEHGIPEIENGKIDLMVSRTDDMLLVSISDNGIGKDASAKKHVERNRESMGTRITQERIELFNRVYKTKGGIHYKEVPVGTLVEITLPIIEEEV